MRVLVTGGTGVVGEAAVRGLLARGHTVRLLSRHAERDARVWPEGVESRDGDVTRAETLRGAADGCDAVLHLVAVVDEAAPELTFERVNVAGTRHVLAETERAGVPHFVYVSSLGADDGESPYHQSKRAGEEATRGFSRRWVIVRPGNVYGPGDEQISLLLRMVRTLPAVPVLGGDQEFQPLWADDAGQALAAACERDDLAGRVLEIAGPDRTSMGDLVDRFGQLTGRTPTRVPVPGFVASLGIRAAELAGVGLPINAGQLTMLAEGNVIDGAEGNALERVLGVTPTTLDAGLRQLLDSLPEQLPTRGVGGLHRKRFWADIVDSPTAPEALFTDFCARFQEISPESVDLEAEPGAPTAALECGQTLTMALPLRGNVQVRVAELTPTALTLQTVEGHPLAGAVRFTVGRHERALRFQVEAFERAASTLDWLAMATVGGRMQNATWRELVEKMVAECGGQAPDGVQEERTDLNAEDAEQVEQWLDRLAVDRKRAENENALKSD